LPGVVALALVLSSATARGQLPDNTEERLKMLTDPEALKKKLEKDKQRPPLEIFRSQVAPFDILPYVKPNHWVTLGIEMRANHDDYSGWLQSFPVPLLGMPQQVVYRRDARLLKEQRSRLSQQVMLPTVPREFTFELLRPDSIRSDEIWPASLRVLEPHQMLILVLTKEGNDAYNHWGRFQALNPSMLDRADVLAVERQRYYRLVLPLEPDKPPLSPHPLTWTPISHVVWDAMPPDRLNVGQQQALVDWLHWGGQLVVAGGGVASYEVLRDSFLSPYLPAEPTGESALLAEDDLAPLSAAYPPPARAPDPNDPQPIPSSSEELGQLARRYRANEPVIPASNRPLYVAGLRPLRPDATRIPLGEGSKHLLGIEERVGRGRVLMLAVSPTDPALASWPGIDTLVRRVLLRRPEEPKIAEAYTDSMNYHAPAYGMLAGPDLSWVRYLSRDLGSAGPRPLPYGVDPNAGGETAGATTVTKPASPQGPDAAESALHATTNLPVAEWVDSSTLPRMSQDLLKDASGITIPSSTFVFKVILAYLIALVPLNWLVCRYVLGRREWAWAVVPALALGFAIGVERAAAYDVGYDLACDEIDVLELFGGYPRAHLSRFASLYSTGRVRFNVSYPNDPTALALPLISGSYLKGEESSTAVWRSTPVPTLEGYQVQPRTLGMFRAEQMANMPGSVTLATDQGPRRVVNDTDLELRDAVLIDLNGPKDRAETYLGTIGPRASVEVKAQPAPQPQPAAHEGPAHAAVLKELRAYYEDRPENSGEIRLVAWSPKPAGGQKIEPAVDRHRGFTAVVVHLRQGPPPSPDGARYNGLALASERNPVVQRRNEGPSMLPGGMPLMRRQRGAPPNLGVAPRGRAGRAVPVPPAAMPPAPVRTP
jgi:hypothetical protein